MGKLEGKVAVITGASGGLGKQMAIRFAEEGADLAICARTEGKLQLTKKLCEEIGAEVVAEVADVGKPDDLKRFVETIAAKYGSIDILVNNAATISEPKPFIVHTMEDLNEAINSGLHGTWCMMQLCYPLMKEKGGAVINFGSMGGVSGLEGFAAYAAEKEAIRGLSRVVAREWGIDNIRVNCVCPNVVTDRFEEGIKYSPKEMQEYLIGAMEQNAMHRMGKAYDDFTPAAVFLASDDSRWITGQTLHVEGGSFISA